ncbi:MAG: hypothetical protein VB108_07330 [Anaerolineaceae bacterium]|nr:hypothetical protein [Anaerolineaceae bacterium]
MDNNNLIERYIYAVTKQLPESKRDDVSMELRSSIEDMLEAKAQGAEASAGQVRDLLNEMGNPAELAEKYQGRATRALIGQPHYDYYKQILPIAILIVASGIILGQTIDYFSNGLSGTSFALFLLKTFEDIFSGSLMMLAWVTLIFAILHRTGAKIQSQTDFLDHLPELPNAETCIPRAESIIGIVFSLIFLVIFLFVVPSPSSTFLNGLDPAVHASSRWMILGLGLVNLLREIVRLVEGQKSRLVLFAGIFSAVLSSVLAYLWLSQPGLISQAVIQHLKSLGLEESQQHFITWVPKIILGGIVFGSAIEIIRNTVGLIKRK